MPILDDTMNRRSFLRGSSLFAAAALAAPLTAFAQQAAPGQKPDEKKEPPAEATPDRGPTLKDEQGREYRVCPQCGYNMYKQENTWTCENCGYSYVE
jgi:rubrerythrin